jgi:hypothetical protein
MRNLTRPLSKLALGALLLGGATCADQPKNRCKVAPGVGLAYFSKPKATTGDCSKMTLPTKGEAVGMNAFVPNPTLPAAPDTPTSLSIKPGWLGDRISEARDRATQDPMLEPMKEALLNYPYGSADAVPKVTDLKTTQRPYAFGKFKTVFPDDNGVCEAGELNASDLDYPAIPKHSYPDPEDATKMLTVEELPATAVKYEWRKVRTVQIASSPGTQTFADLTITRDGCAVTYGVAILVPMVGCGVEKDGAMMPDDKLCSASPNEESLFGSGISQHVPTKCEDISDDPMSPNFVCAPTKTAP